MYIGPTINSEIKYSKVYKDGQLPAETENYFALYPPMEKLFVTMEGLPAATKELTYDSELRRIYQETKKLFANETRQDTYTTAGIPDLNGSSRIYNPTFYAQQAAAAEKSATAAAASANEAGEILEEAEQVIDQKYAAAESLIDQKLSEADEIMEGAVRVDDEGNLYIGANE